MKIFYASKVMVTKKFAAKAALYRRLAKSMGSPTHTFSHDDLIEIFKYESNGIGPNFSEMKLRNGFALGKWIRDINVAQY